MDEMGDHSFQDYQDVAYLTGKLVKAQHRDGSILLGKFGPGNKEGTVKIGIVIVKLSNLTYILGDY